MDRHREHMMMEKQMRKFVILTGVAALAVAGSAALTMFPPGKGEAQTNVKVSGERSKAITIYRDPNCGCCDAYGEYLETNGYQVTRVDDRDFDKRSVAAGVPEQGLGCHLAEIDGYVVSGLVPAEIIERMLDERPEITGITLPGMPPNAPGMAREKTGTLKTYAFGEDGIAVYANE